jgi:uncharacterized membrane protein
MLLLFCAVPVELLTLRLVTPLKSPANLQVLSNHLCCCLLKLLQQLEKELDLQELLQLLLLLLQHLLLMWIRLPVNEGLPLLQQLTPQGHASQLLLC